MTFSIDKFKSEGLSLGGARPSLFEVDLNFPGFVTNSSDIKSKWVAKSSFLPASITTSMNINYLGRVHKIPGERTFPQWTVTFINDEDFKLRNALEEWADHISGFNKIGQSRSYDSTVDTNSTGNNNKYSKDADIYQISKDGRKIKQYKFIGLYPITLTDIAVSWDSPNTIEEFTATFDYQYYITYYGALDGTETKLESPYSLTT